MFRSFLRSRNSQTLNRALEFPFEFRSSSSFCLSIFRAQTSKLLFPHPFTRKKDKHERNSSARLSECPTLHPTVTIEWIMIERMPNSWMERAIPPKKNWFLGNYRGFVANQIFRPSAIFTIFVFFRYLSLKLWFLTFYFFYVYVSVYIIVVVNVLAASKFQHYQGNQHF